MEERGKIYWHGAFVEALKLELEQYRDVLKYETECQLTEEALRMDVLVIKVDKDVKIEKNIGKIFRTYNIVEYKSETDSFSIWDYNKTLAYALLYTTIKKVHLSDITISIALTIYPRDLLKFLKNERGLDVHDVGDGIYYIKGDIVTVQIIESKKLLPENNIYMRNLRSNLSAEEMYQTLESYKERKPLDKRSVYVDRLIKANPEVFKEVLKMLSEEAVKIIIEGIEESGRFADLFEKQIEKNDKKWLTVVAKKDEALAEKDEALAEKDEALAEKDEALAEKDAQIAKLLTQLNGSKLK